jgi:hypothetical protein
MVDVWKGDYKKELGVVPPEAVTYAALRHNVPQRIVHYFQPHIPYIGEFRLPLTSTDWKETMAEAAYKQRLRDGEITNEELRRAYRSNLERVINAVVELVRRLDVPVAITGDHGELLGEDDRYFHGGDFHPNLNTVPWLVVSDEEIGTSAKPLPQHFDCRDDASQTDLEDQLQSLGYL